MSEEENLSAYDDFAKAIDSLQTVYEEGRLEACMILTIHSLPDGRHRFSFESLPYAESDSHGLRLSLLGLLETAKTDLVGQILDSSDSRMSSDLDADGYEEQKEHSDDDL